MSHSFSLIHSSVLIKSSNYYWFASADLFFALLTDRKRVLWEDPKKDKVKGCIIKFDGKPFHIISVLKLNCQHGTDKNKCHKKKYAEKKRQENLVKSTVLV